MIDMQNSFASMMETKIAAIIENKFDGLFSALEQVTKRRKKGDGGEGMSSPEPEKKKKRRKDREEEEGIGGVEDDTVGK